MENHSFPADYLFFSSCTFGLIQKYQKIKAFQEWLKTGERFGRNPENTPRFAW